MDKTTKMEVTFFATEELKPEFPEDQDEAWLDGLVSYLNAVADWEMEKASNGLMADTMRKLPPALPLHWDDMISGNSISRLLNPGIFIDVGFYDNQGLQALKMKNLWQGPVELAIGWVMEKPDMEDSQKTAGTQTNGKTTRDAGIQVRMEPLPRSSPTSGKLLANCK